MLLALTILVISLLVLIWSADRFVDGSAATARYFGMPTLLIGMVVIGFGTSAPEMLVSASAAMSGNAGLALGNAYGSNIGNIGLILAVTALLGVIPVASNIIKREMPVLLLVTLLAGLQLLDGEVSRIDAAILVLALVALVGWSVREAKRGKQDPLAKEMEAEAQAHAMPIKKAVIALVVGFVLLIASARALVWAAVEIATAFGVSDLIVGLTIVAVGTSLPELASSIAAARKKEPDLVIGNIIGSNLFNTLIVVGGAGLIAPLAVPQEVLWRDYPVMLVTTLLLMVMILGRGKAGGITPLKGGLLLAGYVGYTAWLIHTAIS